MRLQMSLTHAALRASQRLAALAASASDALCLSASPHESASEIATHSQKHMASHQRCRGVASHAGHLYHSHANTWRVASQQRTL